jgi:putative nucleotidyltransferase with HDIG domain
MNEMQVPLSSKNTSPLNMPGDGQMQETIPSLELLKREALKKKILSSLDSLLPLPQVVLKAQNLLLDPNSSFNELADIIETDQEITLKILKMANSAFYSLKNEVCSVRQACVILGFSVIGEIIMAAGTSTLFSKPLTGYGMNPKSLWQHSLAVALASRKIANAIQSAQANEAFLCGLFHDVGKLILDEHIFSHNDEFKDFLVNGDHPNFEIEKQILGFEHSEIASELCKSWEFPKAVTRAIKRHHFLNSKQASELAIILNAADTLIRIRADKNGNGRITDQIDPQVMEFLALNEDDLSSIMAEVNESVRKITDEIFRAAS